MGFIPGRISVVRNLPTELLSKGRGIPPLLNKHSNSIRSGSQALQFSSNLNDTFTLPFIIPFAFFVSFFAIIAQRWILSDYEDEYDEDEDEDEEEEEEFKVGVFIVLSFSAIVSTALFAPDTTISETIGTSSIDIGTIILPILLLLGGGSLLLFDGKGSEAPSLNSDEDPNIELMDIWDRELERRNTEKKDSAEK